MFFDVLLGNIDVLVNLVMELGVSAGDVLDDWVDFRAPIQLVKAWQLFLVEKNLLKQEDNLVVVGFIFVT